VTPVMIRAAARRCIMQNVQLSSVVAR